MLPLEGKVAVITGGTSGIGARTAEVFVANGAEVVIVGRRQERGEKLARKLGDAASFICTDVSAEADVKAMIDHAVDRFGRLDCLMNNAGRGSQYAAITEVDLEQFDAVIAVHLRAVLAGMKYAARVMAVQGAGSIINVASVNGFRAGLGGYYYSAAKAAAIHLTRCAAMELGEKGIRVNSLSPGMIATGAFAKFIGMQPDEADDHPEYAETAIDSVAKRWQPLQYVGRTDDIAQAALFLASDASRFVTGQNLVVDGGISAGWAIAAVRSDRELFFHTIQASVSPALG
jgi:NAD(P)-dependent dehydrogenase (short-subunit alcohol dehydrogenase family)